MNDYEQAIALKSLKRDKATIASLVPNDAKYF